MNVMERLALFGVVPVIKIEDAADAAPICRALNVAGMGVAEITFRTAAAEESIRRVIAELPDMLVGAGTVTTIEQAERAAAAGASFIVSAGLNPKVVIWCKEHGMPVIPGVNTPTEIEAAMELGLETVKFFPAEASGGLPMLKQFHGPYAQMKFMPTGGVNPDNLNGYLSAEYVLACGGTWLVPGDAVKNKDFARITQIAEQTVASMLNLRLAHAGLHFADGEKAGEAAALLGGLLNRAPEHGNSSIFVGGEIEACKSMVRDTAGHLCFRTSDVERAIFYLERRGFHFDREKAKLDEKGRIKAVYLLERAGEFSLHLLAG